MVKDIVFEGCSPRVEKALSADIMKSVKSVVPDLLASLPMLLYQGPLPSMGLAALLRCTMRGEIKRINPSEAILCNLRPFANRFTVLLDGRPKSRLRCASTEAQ